MKTFNADLYRYIGEDYKRLKYRVRYIIGTPGVTYTYFFRHATESRFAPCRLFWRGMVQICKFITGIQIPVGTSIGEGFRILHFGAIVVNPDARIGRNCTIAQGVLVGGSDGKRAGCPTIGDNCCLIANSIIIGGINVGNDVLIAPGAFVNFDVPDNSIVLGNPGQIIQRETSPTKKYIVYSCNDMK